MYGPAWQKRLEVQEKIRNLEESDVLQGGRAVYNHAFNDGGAPTSSTTEPLDYINDQNATHFKKSPLEGYAILLALIETDVTREFLDKFQPLFKKCLAYDAPLRYVNSPFPSALEIQNPTEVN